MSATFPAAAGRRPPRSRSRSRTPWGRPPLVPIPAGTRVASLPGPGEVPQNYETGEDLDARPGVERDACPVASPQELTSGATHAFVAGSRTGPRRRRRDPGRRQRARRRQARVSTGSSAASPRSGWSRTSSATRDRLGRAARPAGRAVRDERDERIPRPPDLRLFVLRKKAAIFGASAPDWRLISESVGGGGRTRRPPPAHARRGALHRAKQDDLDTTGPDWPELDRERRGPAAEHGRPRHDVPDRGARLVGRALPAHGHRLLPDRDRLRGVPHRLHPERQGHPAHDGRALGGRNCSATMSGRPSPGSAPSSCPSPPSRWTSRSRGARSTSRTRCPTPAGRSDRGGQRAAPRSPRPGGRPRPAAHARDRARSVELHPGDLLEIVGPATANSDGTTTWVSTAGSVTARRDTLDHGGGRPGRGVLPGGGGDRRTHPRRPGGRTALRFTADLAGTYDRTPCACSATSRAPPTARRRSQVLGSGTRRSPFQRFVLAQLPLTYVLAPSGGAVLSTLEVRVDGRLWTEVPQLFGAGPDEEIFTTRSDEEGHVTVSSATGVTGSRLPTGSANVTATYRIGSGLEGRVDGGPAHPADDPPARDSGRSPTRSPPGSRRTPRSSDEMRADAPRTALTLDRVVSLRDVEDFARSVPGDREGPRPAGSGTIGDGSSQLTVAGTGRPVDRPHALEDLTAALRSAGDPRLPLAVAEAEVVPVHGQRRRRGGSRPTSPPRPRRGRHLGDRGVGLRARRSLGQPLTSGDIILAAHAVPGWSRCTSRVPVADVRASRAHVVGGVTVPAQLVVLAAGGLTVTEVVS